jgi:chromosome segregation ATPase
MESEYDEKLKDLQAQYKAELERKNELNKELQAVKIELQDIEESHPKEIKSLQEQIAQAKKKTEEYEQKTKELADELRKLKAAQGGAGAAPQKK